MDLKSILEYESPIYQTKFAKIGLTLSYRLLTLKEYRRVCALKREMHEYLLWEEVFKICFIGKYENLDEHIPMGTTLSIGRFIMWMSGDCDLQTIDNWKRDIEDLRRLNPYDGLMSYTFATIKSVTSETPEQLKDLTRVELLRRFIEAECILSNSVPEYKKLDVNQILKTNEQKEEQYINIKEDNKGLSQGQKSPRQSWEEEEENAKRLRLKKEHLKKLEEKLEKENNSKSKRG